MPAPDLIRALRFPPHVPSSSGRHAVDLRDRGRRQHRHASPAAGGTVDLVQMSNGVAEVRATLEGIVRRPRGYPTAIVRLWLLATFVQGVPQQTCNSRLRS